MAYGRVKLKKLAKPKVSADDKAALGDGQGSVPALVMRGLREDFGKEEGLIFVSNMLIQDPVYGYVSTGSFQLDCAIGLSFRNDTKDEGGLGIPYPCVVEIVGLPSSGKSILLYHILANVQREDGWVNLIDVERTLTADYARISGMSLSETCFGYSVAATITNMFKIVRRTVDRHVALMDLKMLLAIGVDSLGNTTTDAEIGTEKDTARAEHARIIRRELRATVIPTLSVKVPCVDANGKKGEGLAPRPLLFIFLNHLTATMAKTMYEKQYDSFGGSGLKYDAKVRILLTVKSDLYAKERSKEAGDAPSGMRCQAEIIKNKVAPAGRKVQFDIWFDTGIEDYTPVIEFLEKRDKLTRGGNYYHWSDKKMLKDAFRDYLAENPAEWEKMQLMYLDVVRNEWKSGRGNTRKFRCLDAAALPQHEELEESELELGD